MSTFKITEETRCELEKFKEYMRAKEYSDITAAGYCTYLSRALRQGRLGQGSLRSSIGSFLEAEKSEHPKAFKQCRPALKLYFEMLTGGKWEDKPEIRCHPETEKLLQRFRKYSLDVKGLEEGTVASEISHVREFLEYVFARNPQSAAGKLTAEDIRDYVVERLARLSDSSKGRYITSIRNFFRCQAFHGEPIHKSIFLIPLSPAVWKNSAFPTTISMGAFNTLHEIPDRNTDTGKRNRCIILCFTELALRCSEVAALTLDDFNWHSGHVTIRKTKTASERALPLSEKLWDALVEYLSQSRPQTLCRVLFVRFSHKRGEAMGAGQVRNVVRLNGAKANLEDKDSGTHILRRTAATKLYNSGNSLKLTADILGHESLDSTTHYAKADISGLSSVASPWPGGESSVG